MSQGYLPAELWRMVLLELGIPRRNALHPVLTVSHALHDIAIPMIYENILIPNPYIVSHHADIDSESIPLMPCNQTWTYVPSERLQSLVFALEVNGEVAQHTTTFVQEDYSELIPTPLRTIINQFSCLKRLHLSICSARALSEIILSIRPSVALTHLSLPSIPPRCLSMAPFLHRQRNSLSFLICGDDIRDRNISWPTSLETLDTFEGTSAHRWDALAPLKHLLALEFEPSLIQDPGRVFASLVSLKVSIYNPPETISVIGPFLMSLQFLHLSSSSGVGNKEICVRDLMKISPKDLKYIHYFKRVFDSKKEFVELEPVFEFHTSLSAVDIGHWEAVYQPPYTYGYRFRRNIRSPVHTLIRDRALFEEWWEPVQEFL